MRGAVPFRRRAVAEFGRFSTGLLIAYVPVAAILTFAAGVPLVGVLIVGAVGVPALAALFAVLKAGVGARRIRTPAARAPMTTILAPTPLSGPAAVTAVRALSARPARGGGGGGESGGGGG